MSNKETRLQRAYERLGTNDPRCVFCQKSNPLCLERHHLSGQAFGDELVIVCRNCHRELSDAQKDHPQKSGDDPTLGERVAHFLLGLADVLVFVATYCREHATRLLEAAGILVKKESAQ